MTTRSASCPAQSDTPNFGPNVHIFDPSMSAASIQATLDTVFNTQKPNQFGTQRDALLFKPGTYSVEANVGYYTSVAGLGLNPDDVTINGDVTVDAFDGTGNATQNFWRSAENLSINPCAGSDRWAVAQAAPFRRIDVHGGLELDPASYGYASGGYIADTKVSGQVSSVSQQQWYSRDSNFGSWAGGVWNMVFSAGTTSPAQSFPTPPMTTLATTPVSRDVPYLYIDSSGNYHVFVPSLRTNASGPSWASGPTPGTSVPMSQFYRRPVDERGDHQHGPVRGLQPALHPGRLQPEPDAQRHPRQHDDSRPRLPHADPAERREHHAGRGRRRRPDRWPAVRRGHDQLSGAADRRHRRARQ